MLCSSLSQHNEEWNLTPPTHTPTHSACLERRKWDRWKSHWNKSISNEAVAAGEHKATCRDSPRLLVRPVFPLCFVCIEAQMMSWTQMHVCWKLSVTICFLVYWRRSATPDGCLLSPSSQHSPPPPWNPSPPANRPICLVSLLLICVRDHI